MPWATTIRALGFLAFVSPIEQVPDGQVVVLAPCGVDEHRWMPVDVGAIIAV